MKRHIDKVHLNPTQDSIPHENGGGLVKEGANNIDINTETIDGKDIFHSMSRAVFQIRHYNEEPNIDQSKIKRTKERSIQIDDSAFSLSACMPFVKPETRETACRNKNVYGNITDCASKLFNTSEMLWVLLRSISRKNLDIPVLFPTDVPQKIPFWTGYNSCLSNFKPHFSIVSYTPIIDIKPNDMATVYTTMRKCVDMTVAMGQKYSVQTFDQQLYSIAKQVAWTMPETFRYHIIRLGGFNTLSCFIVAIGKLWGDGGLKDLLVDSSVYASETVDQMMNGKEFNRAVRALTLAFGDLYVSLLSAFFN
ncbi:unnamed protein product [Mytilus edulis]|uniref:Uncharacterized protein n=1 Tax=Mytilus edulis TaxID=6550 RepID=A0A8S3QMZ7_MYTED|nr:unnamed protein product [Mytilus edulis]